MTVLEAHVAPEHWEALRAAYAHQTTQAMPPEMVRTYLAQSGSDPTLWRVLSVWKSREALQAMRARPGTPAGVLVFRAAGAEPTLTIFDIAASATA